MIQVPMPGLGFTPARRAGSGVARHRRRCWARQSSHQRALRLAPLGTAHARGARLWSRPKAADALPSSGRAAVEAGGSPRARLGCALPVLPALRALVCFAFIPGHKECLRRAAREWWAQPGCLAGHMRRLYQLLHFPLLLQKDGAGRRGDGFAPGRGSGQGLAPSHCRQTRFLGRAAARPPRAVPAAPPSCTRRPSQSAGVPGSCICRPKHVYYCAGYWLLPKAGGRGVGGQEKSFMLFVHKLCF